MSALDHIVGGARLLVDRMPGFMGEARLYELDPPLQWTDWNVDGDSDDDRIPRSARWVIVSAVVAWGEPETYIFPAKKAGDSFEIASWSELKGSFRGGLDHEAALVGAGYVVIG